ncbi:uncharacterized protein LOC115630642 [Scaptodrosophila lebanonensis]|uniref:Uncharacterized protein LOC115630642 n=1 Tax=Drosophila lebanonensis TaxID=7225 RepID=A0A6J2U7J4_DROLE|nr:uncharacterized protein LOC115630642 [Scaptodrosophila lebanonensis]
MPEDATRPYAHLRQAALEKRRAKMDYEEKRQLINDGYAYRLRLLKELKLEIKRRYKQELAEAQEEYRERQMNIKEMRGQAACSKN